MNHLKPLLLMLVTLTSGCSMLPYENDFSCRMKDNYGKCISVAGAYQEAVTGESVASPMQPASKQNSIFNKKRRQVIGASKNAVFANATHGSSEDTAYKKISGLIDSPQTPMLQPAKTIRTLVVSYSPSSKKDTLYMPRYVYTAIQDPKWVVAQHINDKPGLAKGLADTRKLSN